MNRLPRRLFDQPFDVVVVGGGIYGATITLAASRRGYRVALVEKGDFNSGTSANSLKILHGGLRYLQHLNLGRMRRSIRSRNFFLRHFPHLIDNVPFLMPLRGYGMKGPLVMGAGLLINDLFSMDRNTKLDKTSRIGRGQIIGARRTKALVPGVDLQNCTGGAVWFESVVDDTERLVLGLIKSAAERGATPINYATATSLVQNENRITGVICRDLLNAEQGQVHSPVVVDASGPDLGTLGMSLPGYSPALLSRARAVNVVLKGSLFGNTAVGLPYQDDVTDELSLSGDDERKLFFVPWKGKTMVGTFYDLEQSTERGLHLTDEEKTRFLLVLKKLLPGQTLTLDDVCRWHSGWLPLSADSPPGRIDLAKSSTIRSLRIAGQVTGLVEVSAAKFTTAPAVAKRVLEYLAAIAPSPAAKASITAPRGTSQANDSPLAKRLQKRYGADWMGVFSIIETDPGSENIVADRTTAAEVLYAIREEMACRLSDVVLRRTDMAECRLPHKAQLEAVADLMAREIGWNQSERKQQLDQLLGETGHVLRQQG